MRFRASEGEEEAKRETVGWEFEIDLEAAYAVEVPAGLDEAAATPEVVPEGAPGE